MLESQERHVIASIISIEDTLDFQLLEASDGFVDEPVIGVAAPSPEQVNTDQQQNTLFFNLSIGIPIQAVVDVQSWRQFFKLNTLKKQTQLACALASMAILAIVIGICAKLLHGPSDFYLIQQENIIQSRILKSFMSQIKNGKSRQQNQLNWFGDDPCKNWTGIICNNENKLIGINLNFLSEVSISIPPNFSKLQYLEQIIINKNNIVKSALPEQLSVLNIKKIQLSGTLNGTLPPEFSTWENIQNLQLTSKCNSNYQNNTIQSTLPPQYQNWQFINNFNVSCNNISGQIPTEYSLWNNIQKINFANNSLTGNLPQEFSTWKESVQYFNVQQNNFSGNYPIQYSVFVNISRLLIAPQKQDNLCLTDSEQEKLLQQKNNFSTNSSTKSVTDIIDSNVDNIMQLPLCVEEYQESQNQSIPEKVLINDV
eukprot:TRINITY_DN289_c0_g1_i3.p1 TRINITY_DN289_c0_g1~~TRINITY_DN289_c0_g1_i3.p1  ORF type:complete len:426 (-),score=36.20 TRINITY_DN289_c0_g1_i3:165-1442(-)